MISIHVPAMTSRQDVRAVSARINDVPGVQTLQVDYATRTVRVTGPADPTAVTAAIGDAGYATGPDPVPTDGSPFPGMTRTGELPVDTFFSTDIADLPPATRPELLELRDGDEMRLRIAPVTKRLGDATVRMLAYNGSIPGPTLRVRQGSEIVVHVTNDTDMETTVHWHGLRLENRYDGVPYETQAPIPPGGQFTYRVRCPDAGGYWYHPHVREDVQQEMGLYGTILVDPAEPDYWPAAHRDVVLTLDDVLVEGGAIAPFSRAETNYAAMGRYGNVLLISGETDLSLTARTGEVVRLWLTNTANSRVFRVALPGARMKLVGGDSGRVEHEQFVSDVVLSPSERAVVDVLFDRAGELTLEHRSPRRTYRLASITVTEELADPPLAEAFGVLRSAPELTAERKHLEGWLAAPPDKVLAIVAEMEDPAGAAAGPVTYACPMHPDVVSDQPGRCPKCGMKLMATAAAVTYACPMHPDVVSDQPGQCPKCGMKLLMAPAAGLADSSAGDDTGHGPMGHESDHGPMGHESGHGPMGHESRPEGSATVHDATHAHADHGAGTADGVEWEDDMAEANRQTTTATMRWQLLDRTAGGKVPPVDWRFTVGDRVKIRLVNEMDSDHPMHHPFHVHGAGRFLVLARDGVPEPNLGWKDTVLVRTGEVVDILLELSTSGTWMAHCHIAEHLHAGMMFSFTVAAGGTR
ncbi:multicopper oxidase domain-containing protein [Blastococcus deserti]|uniref:Multicopper oxidase domain-containing protein n=1 Tax=Blastococcus deserti TaxID=2259033 RepID=A0ABW4XAN8_9ACTN